MQALYSCLNNKEKREKYKEAEVVFEELSSGVYFVKKDKNEDYNNLVTSEIVTTLLDSKVLVMVEGIHKTYSNFHKMD